MEKLKASGEYDKNRSISIVVGHKKELPKNVKPGKDLIGDCLKKYSGQGVFSGVPTSRTLPSVGDYG